MSLFCAAEKNTDFYGTFFNETIMVFWQQHYFPLLLLAFGGLNLIRSDCGTDVDRLNGGFCDDLNNLRRIDNHNDKEFSRQFRDIERRGKFNDKEV